MKKIISLLLAVICIFGAISFTSCKEEEHTCSFGEWNVVKKPTVLNPGAKERSCECGASKREEIPALGTDYVKGLLKGSWCATGSWGAFVFITFNGDKFHAGLNGIDLDFTKYTGSVTIDDEKITLTEYNGTLFNVFTYTLGDQTISLVDVTDNAVWQKYEPEN